MKNLALIALMSLLAGCLAQAPAFDDDDDDANDDDAANDDDDGDDDDATTPCEEVQWWQDSDGDEFGDVNVTQWACTQPDNYVDNPDDCNDLENTVHPNAPEICDTWDNDCDGSAVAANMVSARAPGDATWTDVTASFGNLVGTPGSDDVEWMVCDGTFVTDVVVTGSLRVYGRDGTATLTGEDSHRLFWTAAAGAVLELHNLHIVGGGGTSATALSCNGGTTVRVFDSFIHDNGGPGVLGGACDVLIENTEMTSNVASTNLLTAAGGTWTISGSTMSVTTLGEEWSTIRVFSGSDVTMTSSTIEASLGRAVEVDDGGSFTCNDGSGFGAGFRDQYDPIAVGVFGSGEFSWNGCDAQNVTGQINFLTPSGGLQTVDINGLDRTINCSPYAGGTSCSGI